MLLRNDDDVHRFQGRWIEMRGTVLWVQARYAAWGVFVAVTAAGMALLYLALRWDFVDAAINSVAFAVLVSYGVMTYATGDLTLRGLVETVTLEVTGHARARLARDPRPARVTLSRVRVTPGGHPPT